MKITISPVVEIDVWEPPYLLKTLEYLSHLPDDYHFVIARVNNDDELRIFKSLLIDGLKNILILISDELGLQNYKSGPYFMKNDIHLIFRTYNNKDLYDNDFVYPIPCGFSCGVSSHSSSGLKTIYHNFESVEIPLIDRKYDIFLSGAFSNNRVECFNQIESISDKFNCLINKTPSFAKGFPIDEYYEMMSNSKIAIVPDGVVIPESFRYFEAVKCNCIVVTSYPIYNDKYQNWYFNNSSAIFIKSWSEVNYDFIKNLLENSNLMKYDILNRKYFNENISPKALSEYMINIINKKILKNEK
jgi:hypothetical protein